MTDSHLLQRPGLHISQGAPLEMQQLPSMDILDVDHTNLYGRSLISRLPLEILERLFALCVSGLYGYSTPRYPLAWAQVCRLWRQVALNSPRLWSTIDLCKPTFARAFVDRSQAAPLSIISNSPLKVDVECLTPHAGRIHSIDVRLFPYDMAKLFEAIHFRTDNITNLTLQLSPLSPGLFLDISLPSVRRLVLSCVAVRWETCRQLTHLSIRGLDSDLSPTLSSLYSIFLNSPYLEYVRLESIIPADIGETLPDTVAPLIHLRALILSAPPAVISSIIHGVEFTSRTRVQLYTSLSEDLHYLFPRGTFPFDSQKDRTATQTVRLARHAAYFLNENAAPWSTSIESIRFSISSSTFASMHVLNSIPSLLNPLLITSIELSTGVLTDIPDFALRWLLSQTRNLESIRIAFNHLAYLLHLLTPLPDTPHEPATSAVLCPRLSVMSFNRPGDFWWNFAEHWLQPIFDCVYHRHILGAPLGSLEFYRCHGMTADMEDRFYPFLHGPRLGMT
ncbi:hypothetical protein CC2G_006342 [Coprinopsis cinerea AmutBmut pab1-1]|nr:hypothetical protein CC2G_006342 [Coprinopsis cinerea AmutBmut pab1-1]